MVQYKLYFDLTGIFTNTYNMFIILVMFVTQVLFIGYDIGSEMTKTDILDGTTVIIIELLFIGLGIYAHRLAYRLFVHPKFLDMMRLHSKTIFKVIYFIVSFIICIKLFCELYNHTCNIYACTF